MIQKTKKAKEIRQPIVTVVGHVDHGKTSILDSIRGTAIQEKEAGGITQKISFTSLPSDVIQERSEVVLDKFKIPLKIPGFLFIDTPGHAAFTNLRKRGGSLADLAVLVIDINEGIQPQTAEVLQILKANKTPFIIALNKIDNISGWQSGKSGLFFESIEQQVVRVREQFDEKFYTLVGALNSYKFEAELYTKISDFSKKIAVVPCSAQTGEGISEILGILSALSQKFLMNRLLLGDEAKGVVLEVKKEKGVNYLESILYDGLLNIKDEIAIANFGSPILTKIRTMQEALALSKGYKTVKEIKAASGARLQIISKEDVLPGMRFSVVNNNLDKIKKEFSQDLEQEIKTDKKGIIVKADSLGSLEALLVLLKQNRISVAQAGIGDIAKKDVYKASANKEEESVVMGFNVNVSEDVGDEDKDKKVKILTNEVIYKLIEDFEEWKTNKLKEIERRKLGELQSVFKLSILPYVFRNSNPAIFGVKVSGGTLKKEVEIINKNDVRVGRIKEMQEEKNSVSEAEQGKEIAISVPGVNFERQLKSENVLYSNLSESQFRKFKEHKELLTKHEMSVLQEIAQIKRKTKETWGV